MILPAAAAANAELSEVIVHCTDPKAEAASITESLSAAGWTTVVPDDFERAARHLGDGGFLLTQTVEEPQALMQLREAEFRKALSRVKRKTSDYFYSATLQSADLATVVNVHWKRQGNRLQCSAATADRTGIEELGAHIASLTSKGRASDTGPSLHYVAATGKDDPLRVWLSAVKDETTAVFSAAPLLATVGLFAEYFPRRD
ncbi:hypothetical protein [uncultured Tateyamaria sp.]|uniref:hypothetical protein n=1 Tax=Tateyamaria sp. 1078 TaxID=3417464 RepID=UPI0026221706|nr:hypothetical protein [uncultured Tateyamaria sp.]